MIKDFLISFTDNFKEKTKNPFLGTYLLVWLIRNWNLVYTLFNFDENSTLDDKKDFITNYYTQVDFVANLGINILWAFGLLIATYLLLNISRLIVNLSEKRLTPWIYKITDSKSIVLKAEYERIRAENDDLQLRLDKERESKSRLEIRIKSLEEEIIKITTAKVEIKTETEKPSKSQTTKQSAKDNVSIFIKKLKDKNLLKQFVDTCTLINKGESVRNDYEPKDYFFELGLIKYRSYDSGVSKYYSITPDGENVLRTARLE